MEYIPQDPRHRRLLAAGIKSLMDSSGFQQEENIGELVFSREINEYMRVVVFTSIVGNEVREKDADAIRICGVYKTRDGRERGIVKASRVYRTGHIESISTRLLNRMRAVWKKVKNSEKCNFCGAPKFRSKKGNLVCGDLCYLERQEK